MLENAGRAARSALRLLDAAKGIVAQEPELANYAPALDSDAAFFAALLEYIGAGRWDVRLFIQPNTSRLRSRLCADIKARE